MDLIYGIKDKPKFGKVVLFALQQLLAIMAATIAVPAIIGHGLTASAALFGAGVGTIVYLLFTKSSSPVFLGSSFAFIGSMFSAFAGAATLGLSEQAGYWGLIIGALMAGLVYVIIATIVKVCGVEWINRLMPPVIIGPTVAIIGLSLSGNAIGDLMKSSVEGGSTYVALICGLFTLAVTMLYSTYGKKVGRLIPFILGILGGYILATLFAIIGNLTGNEALIIINYGAVKALDFSSISGYLSLPKFTFLLGGGAGLKAVSGKYLLTLFTAYVPVAFVVFAEHLADHKNLSAIVGNDLLKEPGLTRTLLGDGVGTMVSTFFGGCPNTTYGESIGCVAITRNASTISIWGCAFICIIFSMISPLVALLETIPSCVMGGVCVALYGFIAVSGFKMFQTVDLNKNKNLFVASVIFITGVGGMVVSFGAVEIRTVACALILGILTNLMLSREEA
ncbi:MAG: solute carrier family 23 protein [Treponema sp.]|nr:uracil-xanthine permease [Spirochaetia bacterium]MDD7533716.1 solute carrier family 23 protein [Treponema sp.]MDY3723517.1 solute carrier family 23 protein [Treponema sp.]MDY5759072.1 solute carrier family 23 protein [Treponema sp.]MDY5817333.1 solute carrier family 23 protein [Treponema sp.]